ncbi:MAG: DUF928 domain-containing protein [Cyanomargarita calcarea GSE-NOS-MK-12-04C]|jgi:hypothetical protein|uniref:DUF928 domain-containing protein n=1 Tax=Cyanomargarita calcarea GSE-NOS-MK-12-04C TaxID=2839659 RepID=A0A951QRH5_9CYAN|nr:DUF928 domain-containing protein [Cyanomargarita calcarea GSE-NOS-MK-12-04C]
MVFLVSYPSPTLAANIWEQITTFLGYKPRNVLGVADGRPNDGAGRGECPNLAYEGTNRDKRLISLIPPIKQSNSSSSEALKSPLKSKSKVTWFSTDTIEKKPSLWFYIPYNYNEESQLKYAKLALVDEDKRIVKETPILFKLPEKAGIAQVMLPISLEVNKRYKWFFSIVCDENKPSRNPSVTGSIRRVPPEKSVLVVEQSNTIPAVRYRVYAHSGFLYDAFTWLVKAYEPIKQPNQNSFVSNFDNYQEAIKKDWFDFFKVLDLIDENDEDEKRDETNKIKDKNKIVDEIAKSPILTLECVQKNTNQKCNQ